MIPLRFRPSGWPLSKATWVLGIGLAAAMPTRAVGQTLEGVAAEKAPGVPGETYIGVTPGSGAKNPLPTPTPKPNHLVWTGFKMTPEGSQVFLQTSLAVTYEIKIPDAPKKRRKGAPAAQLSVYLRNCRIHLHNNGRTLNTRFFATPVSGVSARQRHKDVELRIALKEPASAVPRTEAGPDGTQFLVLAFPPGKADVSVSAAAHQEAPAATNPGPPGALAPPALAPGVR